MSLIDTTYAEPKLYLSARRDRDDKPDLETLFLENLGTAEGVRSYARWYLAGDDPEDLLLLALLQERNST